MGVFGELNGWVGLHDGTGPGSRPKEQVVVGFRVVEAKGRKTVLTGPKEIAHAPEPEICTSDLEPIVGLDQRVEPKRGFLTAFRDEDAETFLGASPHPSSQLMQLGKTEAFGVLDNHDGRVGDINPYLDHASGYQDIDLASGKCPHGRVLLVCRHLPVQKPDAQIGKDVL